MLHSATLWLGNNEAALRKKPQQTLRAEQVEGGDAVVLGDDVSLQH